MAPSSAAVSVATGSGVAVAGSVGATVGVETGAVAVSGIGVAVALQATDNVDNAATDRWFVGGETHEKKVDEFS